MRQLRYFQALSETLHFGNAARQLNISQPALSTQIAQMESYLGTELFSRAASGVTLTADGNFIAGRVRRILADVADLESLADRGASILSGRLRVGMIATVAPYLLPKLLPIAAQQFPDLDCEIRESVTDRLVADLHDGDIDCAIVALPIDDARIATVPLVEDVFSLAIPMSEIGRFRSPVPPQLLASERMILLEEGHCMRSQALEICAVTDRHNRARLGATSLTTILRMVAGGLGTTLIPSIAIDDETRAGGIAILPIAAPVPSRHLVLAFRPTTIRAADISAFAELIRQVLQ
ncbi:hydrogen peroxide-inducible genes activator [Fulvimarina sp. 2208YS6-2-32]|uniref:Hydrogen peroxide-inducible genes activator n=2 Tax=Fulvimarina uroteuthidis TaxID=3098149 RepID=A0ABU5I3A8_9HYPH|nr:hydrogen peroxide-inducible genes activator [Fulvimarina sp. 2208YS6-2-32]